MLTVIWCQVADSPNAEFEYNLVRYQEQYPELTCVAPTQSCPSFVLASNMMKIIQ